MLVESDLTGAAILTMAAYEQLRKIEPYATGIHITAQSGQDLGFRLIWGLRYEA